MNMPLHQNMIYGQGLHDVSRLNSVIASCILSDYRKVTLKRCTIRINNVAGRKRTKCGLVISGLSLIGVTHNVKVRGCALLRSPA